jgi:FAD/FMN-containing dehydrogenase
VAHWPTPLQCASDEGFPPGQQHYWKSGYITELGDDLIDVMLERVTEMPSLTSGVSLQQLHGAAGRVAPSASAFAHRGDRYDCLILSQWPDPARSAENIAWTRGLFDAIRPYQAGVYVNNMGADDGDRVRQAYGLNYDRLAELKRIYDPTNVFCSNQNVAPGPSVSA